MFGRKRKFRNVDVEVTEREKVPKGFSYDPYPVWCEEIRSENERKEREAREAFDRLMAEYREARDNLDSYDPSVEVKDYAAGKFLCVDEHELPIAYIEGVDVVVYGGKPSMDSWSGHPLPVWMEASRRGINDWPRKDERRLPEPVDIMALRNPACLAIRMSSGRAENITCHRPHLEILKSRIEQAWKEGK